MHTRAIKKSTRKIASYVLILFITRHDYRPNWVHSVLLQLLITQLTSGLVYQLVVFRRSWIRILPGPEIFFSFSVMAHLPLFRLAQQATFGILVDRASWSRNSGSFSALCFRSPSLFRSFKIVLTLHRTNANEQLTSNNTLVCT